MEKEYRNVVKNIKLTKVEAKTLNDAEKILEEAVGMILNAQCEYDKDLIEVINAGLDGLKKCNPRLNVGIITGKEN